MGNVFVRRVALQLLIPLAILLLPIALTLLLGEFNIWILPALCIMAILVVFGIIFCLPSSFELDQKCMVWSERLHVTDSARELALAVVRVGDLHAIEFRQTAIECCFNIGRIYFMGDIRSIDCAKKVDRPDMPFYYGGICDFEHFKETLLTALPRHSFKT